MSSEIFLSTYTILLIRRRIRDCRNIISLTCTHCQIIKSGSYITSTYNHLINAYLKLHDIVAARKLFDEMPEPNVVSWTSIMAGYIDVQQPGIAVALLNEMLKGSKCKSWPNSYTFATAINACSHIGRIWLGREIHGLVECHGLVSDVIVATALIGMYGKCNEVKDARKVFDKMSERNVITWGSMISAYAQNAQGHDVLELFGEFLRLGSYLDLLPNHFIFSSVVNACASVGRLGLGRSTHASIFRHQYSENDFIASALIDMYSKCGHVDYSKKVFDQMSCPSLVPYTSMIVAAAKYGLAQYSLDLFGKMINQGVKPNSVTLLGVLHACSHSGSVDTGIMHLRSMQAKYHIAPSVKHYTCAVDMLGRAGRLDEAYELANEIQAEGDDALMLWSAMLSASRIHGRLDMIANASTKISEFDRDVAGAYVVMSNAYLSVGQWETAARIRTEMSRQGIKKEPACSWIEIKEVIYVFSVGSASFAGSRKEEMIDLLCELENKMKERGYVSRENRWLFDDGEDGEEGKGVMIGVHSERLALAYGLLCIPKGMTIRIMKNLRMCTECHVAFKLISDIVEREFVVKDLNRFHHFRNGSCTCGDYW